MTIRTLNYAPGNSLVISLWGADSDGSLGQWGSSMVPVQDRGAVTASTLTWNGSSIIGIYDGTFPTCMPNWHASTGAPTQSTIGTTFLMTANKQNLTATQFMRDNSGNVVMGVENTNKVGMTAYVAGLASDTTFGVANGEYFSVFFTYNQNDGSHSSNATWYGKADGTAVAKQASSWTLGTNPGGRVIQYIGGDGSSNFWPSYFVLTGHIGAVLTSTQMQAITDDPYGTFFSAGGGSVKAKSNYISYYMGNAQ